MKNQITFKGGLALIAMSLIFLSSCKKEEITSKTPVSQSGNQNPAKHEYKFSSVAKIPGENPENGFLSLTVSSDDEAFLKKYVAKLEQTKIVFTEVNSTAKDEKNVKPLFGEEESTSSVALDFNWNDFSFEREKGKIYELRLASTDQSKALVYYNAFNNSQFNFGWCVAAVNVYNTFVRPLGASNIDNCRWSFNNTVTDFYIEPMSYHENLEIRCFQNSISNTTPTYSGFQSFTINGIVTYYRPRVNYVSPEMPTGYFDVNAIISGSGWSYQELTYTNAALTFYIAG